MARARGAGDEGGAQLASAARSTAGLWGTTHRTHLHAPFADDLGPEREQGPKRECQRSPRAYYALVPTGVGKDKLCPPLRRKRGGYTHRFHSQVNL